MNDAEAVLSALESIELATLGHFLEEGFCAPEMAAVVPGARMAGVAYTLHLAEPDAVAVNRAIIAAPRGSVLVIEVVGGRHAPVGAITRAAAAARGLAGIVVDGLVTDRQALQDGPLPVFARGFTNLTTKLLDSGLARADVPVMIGDVLIHPGDVVLGDDNGIVALRPGHIDPAVYERARASDAAEPELLQRIAAGEPLEELLVLHSPTGTPKGH